MKRLCVLYGVSRSGYYAWKNRPPSRRRQYDLQLMSAIKESHQGYCRAYGAPRLHQVLRAKGLLCSRRRINRLMREMGIEASTTGLYQWRPGQHAFYSSTGNQLRGAPAASSPGQQWAGDFTYLKTRHGWLYLAVVMDLYSRRVVGWSINRKRNAELTMSALRMALNRGQPKPGCLFHSDQGIEYAAHDYRDLLETAGLRRSMSRKGSPLDNAAVESFFHTFKNELVRRRQFASDVEAAIEIVSYIEFYNRERLHSSIDYQAPESYEALCA